MSGPTDDERALLKQAIAKAEKLLADMTADQEDLDRNPPKIAASDLAAGRLAMQNAIASARRTVIALREAARVADQQDTERA